MNERYSLLGYVFFSFRFYLQSTRILVDSGYIPSGGFLMSSGPVASSGNNTIGGSNIGGTALQKEI